MLRLKVNHKEWIVEGELDPATPLLWVLRDHLGLVGTKFGCGAGYCGACTVHVNGAAVRSCAIRAADMAGVEITTIEGLAQPDGTLHPLQVAWIENDVPQCGYCQAGQLMSAAALLSQKPQPSDEDIDQFMNGAMMDWASLHCRPLRRRFATRSSPSLGIESGRSRSGTRAFPSEALK